MILTGHKASLIVHRNMGGKHVSKGSLTLKNGTRLAQLGLGMLWSHLDPQILYLLIGHACHAATRQKQATISRPRIDQT